jgi:hypothetical protein
MGRFEINSRKPSVSRIRASPSPLDVRSTTACPLIIEVHLAFDSFPVLKLSSPIDLRLSPKHDCPDERIGAVR